MQTTQHIQTEVMTLDTTHWQLQVCVQRRYAPNPTSCAHGGSEVLLSSLREAIHAAQLPVVVMPVSCMLQCEQGPNIKLCASNAAMGQHQQRWHKVQDADIATIVTYCSNIKNCP